MWAWLLCISAIPLFLYLYIVQNDKGLTRLAPEALAFSPTRYTENDARSAAKRLVEHPIPVLGQIPPKTGRRYIVVGGVSVLPFVPLFRPYLQTRNRKAGFLGGWIVLHLIQRGEDPKVSCVNLR